jgi:phthiodiolone/phenolphthiodiolone dimycocerosates ketoreductase
MSETQRQGRVAPVGQTRLGLGTAQQLGAMREAAERAGRDPMAISTAAIIVCLIGETREELEIIARQPLVKSYILQMRGDFVAKFGYRHPLGDDWKGFHDLHTRVLTRDVVTDVLGQIEPQMVLDCIPNGTPREMAGLMKGYIEAGLQVPNFLDYGGMAGKDYSARSAQNVRAAEGEMMRLLAS